MSTSAVASLREKHGLKSAWLSDPAAYPIMGILGLAVTGAFSYIAYKFTYCPDVRVTKKTRGQVVRSW